VENFKFPYSSHTPSEFWGRWHISLSTWFRDYLYIPLGGNRGARWETLRNLGIVMLLAGLWHGSSWIFVLWGAYHGLLLILYRLAPPLAAIREDRLSRQSAWTIPLMAAFTLVGWAIFRSPSLSHLSSWFAALGNWDQSVGLAWPSSLVWLVLHVTPLLLLQILTWKHRDETSLTGLPWALRGVIYTLMLLLIISSAEHDTEFIYFQF
jgi:alginate O-acetyltransferase complex protein AlgI